MYIISAILSFSLSHIGASILLFDNELTSQSDKIGDETREYTFDAVQLKLHGVMSRARARDKL